jgi:hypothetical protein
LTAPSLSVVKNDVAGATSSEPEIQKQINLRVYKKIAVRASNHLALCKI